MHIPIERASFCANLYATSPFVQCMNGGIARLLSTVFAKVRKLKNDVADAVKWKIKEDK